MTMHLSCKRGLLLGGTCELALALARLLIGLGIFPVLTFRSDRGLRTIRDALGDGEDRYGTARLDLADRRDLEALIPPDGPCYDFLVDFVQGNYEALVAAADEEALDPFFIQNVSSRAALLRRITRQMLRQKKGRLVYISSAAAQNPAPGQGFYAAAKLASEALYRSVAIELGPKGITAVILRPGYCDAGRGRLFLEEKGHILRNVPIRRALTAEEIAEAILFLLSDGAVGINGGIIPMDGGSTIGKGEIVFNGCTERTA